MYNIYVKRLNMNKVFDWKGNEIKEGDSVCMIRVGEPKVGNCSLMIVDGAFKTILNSGRKDVWDVGDYHKVFFFNGIPCVYVFVLGFTIVQRVSDMVKDTGDNYILAIKGVSDVKP